MKTSRALWIFALVLAAIAPQVHAAASTGLKWDAVTMYDSGAPLAGEKVVYLVIDATGKQVTSTFATTITADKLPSDGCYTLKAAFYAQETNSVIPASDSIPSAPYCIKPAQKRAATVTGVSGQ